MNNSTNDQAYLYLQNIVSSLNILGIIILLGFSVTLRRYLIKFEHELDYDMLTPSDYAIMVKDLPKHLSSH